MAEAQRFVVRERRAARMLLALVGSPRMRLAFALIAAAVIARAFADYTHEHFRGPCQWSIEGAPGTAYISRYLGLPDADQYLEADPAIIGASQPNLDHFYRIVATRVKTLVGDPRTKYESFVRIMSWTIQTRGWPFVSRQGSFLVDVHEYERFDGRTPAYHTFLAGDDGLDPDRPWGWWGNAAFGGILNGVVVYIILTLVAMGLQRSMRPVTGFPVIVADAPTLELRASISAEAESPI